MERGICLVSVFCFVLSRRSTHRQYGVGRSKRRRTFFLLQFFFESSPMRRELTRRLARLAGAARGDWVATETGKRMMSKST